MAREQGAARQIGPEFASTDWLVGTAGQAHDRPTGGGWWRHWWGDGSTGDYYISADGANMKMHLEPTGCGLPLPGGGQWAALNAPTTEKGYTAKLTDAGGQP